jgi:hypothetical protein
MSVREEVNTGKIVKVGKAVGSYRDCDNLRICN